MSRTLVCLIHVISNSVSSCELHVWLPFLAVPCEFHSKKPFRNKFEGKKNPFHSLHRFNSTFQMLHKLHSIKAFSLFWADLSLRPSHPFSSTEKRAFDCNFLANYIVQHLWLGADTSICLSTSIHLTVQASAEASSWWDVYTLTDNLRNMWAQQNYFHSHLENGWAGFAKVFWKHLPNAEDAFTLTSRLSKIQDLTLNCL